MEKWISRKLELGASDGRFQGKRFCVLFRSWSVFFLFFTIPNFCNFTNLSSVAMAANENEALSELEQTDFSALEESDDLKSIKSDVGANVDYIDDSLDKKNFKDEVRPEAEVKIEKTENVVPYKTANKRGNTDAVKEKEESEDAFNQGQDNHSFDIGEEEKNLLHLAKFVEKKIPEDEWSEILTTAKTSEYVVSEGEYLWKISKQLFGTGFYYSKIWALNSFITNPHEITPGMTLYFHTGDSLSMPEVKVGSFAEKDRNANTINEDFADLGDGSGPIWTTDKEKMMKDGVYFQFATDKTYSDLERVGDIFKKKEFEKYAPPENEETSAITDQYDEVGFSKDSKIKFSFKEGFSFTTFVSSNIVQDLGFIDSSGEYDKFLKAHTKIFVRFNPEVKVLPGDLYSVYTTFGKVQHKNSDRTGHKFSIPGEIKVLRRVSDLWECEITQSNNLISRDDRITVHTERIGKIFKTFNTRNIEAIIADGFKSLEVFSFGDVVYLDRGRADGVEMGNVFEFYSFKDGNTSRKISADPAYKIGEAVVITLTDNFATALVTLSSQDLPAGTLALSKTKSSAMLAAKKRTISQDTNLKKLEDSALDNIDIELDLDDANKELLDKVDKVELTEDELEELDRQEREKSFVQDGEKDLKDLERLEKDIESAQSELSSVKMDKDKLLQNEDLNSIEERTSKAKLSESFESMDEIEVKAGKKYLDEDLNSKENPYGLTEFDLEEIDELLNTSTTGKQKDQMKAKAKTQADQRDQADPTGEEGSDFSKLDEKAARATAPEEKATEMPSEKTEEVATGPSIEPPVEAPAEAPTEKAGGPPADKPADKPAENKPETPPESKGDDKAKAGGDTAKAPSEGEKTGGEEEAPKAQSGEEGDPPSDDQ
jgi:hypothetical protein